MIKVLIQLLFVLLTSSVAFADKEGPESGGGGGVVNNAGTIQLVDFYNIPNSAEQLNLHYANAVSSQSSSEITFSFDRQDSVRDPSFLKVLEIFKKWSDLPYDTIGFLINVAIYRPVIWSFSDEALTAPKSYRPPQLPAELEIETAAYYLKKDRVFQVRISRPIWNKLAAPDQVGLLIHETLRQVQIGLSFGFDDEALQKATAVMMSCKPGVKLDQYLFFLLNNRRDLTEQRFEPFNVLTNECWR